MSTYLCQGLHSISFVSKVYFGGMALSPPARDNSDMERSPATRPGPQCCQPEWSGFKATLGFRIVFRFTVML